MRRTSSVVIVLALALSVVLAIGVTPSHASAGATVAHDHELTSTHDGLVEAQAACTTCSGRGWLLCPGCGGVGTYPVFGYDGWIEQWPCLVCQMRTWITCYTCLGTGQAPGVPYVVMNPTSMAFSATVGGGNPSQQALTVRRSDNGSGYVYISWTESWIQASVTSQNPVTFAIKPQTAGLAPGTYSTNLKVEMWSDHQNGTPVQGSPLNVPITFTVNPLGTVAKPTFTPSGGTFSTAQSATIACATPGATIRYTTDGSDPSPSSALYSGPVSISTSRTLKARAFKNNWTGSTVAQAVFTINPIGTVAAPTFTPSGGTFSSAQSVTIACATPGATIRYTTDGSDPSASSTLYSGPVSISTSRTLKARAFKTGWTSSTVAQAVFTISKNAPATASYLTAGISPANLSKYGASTTISGYLKRSPAGTGIANHAVNVQTYTSGTWQTIQTLATSSSGYVSWSTVPRNKATYRLSYPGVAGSYQACTSSLVQVTPKAYVGAPSTKRVATRTYVLRSILKPRHTSGAYPVRIYRWKKTASGTWKSYGYIKAKAADYGSDTRCSVKHRFPSKGRWRIRAVHPADSGHSKSQSGYTYLTVK